MEVHGEKRTQARGKESSPCWYTVDTFSFPLLPAQSSAESQGHKGVPCGLWSYEGGELGGAGAKYERAQMPYHTRKFRASTSSSVKWGQIPKKIPKWQIST